MISDLPGDKTCLLAIEPPNLTPQRCEKKVVSYLATHSMWDPHTHMLLNPQIKVMSNSVSPHYSIRHQFIAVFLTMNKGGRPRDPIWQNDIEVNYFSSFYLTLMKNNA